MEKKEKYNLKNILSNSEYMSKFFFDMIHDKDDILISNKGKNIPKVIVQYWNDTSQIPKDVKRCIKSWKRLEKEGFRILIFDDISAKKFISEHFQLEYLKAFNLCIHPAMRADFFRLCYLYINGGVYVDADDVLLEGTFNRFVNGNTLKLQPLCYCLMSNQMIELVNGRFDEEFNKDRIYYVNNDPMIAPPMNKVIEVTLRDAKEMLLYKDFKNDFQAIAGPGAVCRSIVKVFVNSPEKKVSEIVSFIRDWEKYSYPDWSLEYRKNNRNWRTWDGTTM